MGILRRVRQWASRWSIFDQPSAPADHGPHLRICSVEELETRRAMAVNPLHFGSVYYEEATGDDSQGDVISITYAGGAPGTQLTQVTIDGDKLGDGLTLGDMFWDIAPGGRGVFNSVPLQIVSHVGFTVNSITLSDGGTFMTIDATGWDPGEKLVFSLDVDEQGFLNSTAVAEGGEWEGTLITGTFTNPNYETVTGSVIYYDFFNPIFTSTTNLSGQKLDLPPDSYIPPDSVDREDRTAGAAFVLQQEPKPIMLSGVVFHDRDLSVGQDAGEEGIAGVTLELLEWNGTAYVSTGKTTVTNDQGEYKFADILPGRYKVNEVQPNGWISTGAKPGTVGGQTRGVTSGTDMLAEIVLDGGEMSVRNDFGEVLPGRISGRVHGDPEGDCIIGPNDIMLAGVKIELLNNNGSVIETTFTNNQGYYEFNNLRPGLTYSVRETQPASYYQGMAKAGTGGGTVNGDLITGIQLTSGQTASMNDFCELLPAEIRGRVWADPEADCVYAANDIALGGVTIELLNSTGTVVATTQTDSQGKYAFTNLAPGVYGVREIQPAGYFQGDVMVGSVGGTKGNDAVTQITLGSNAKGVNYDFCEIIPAKLSGRVWADPEGDCILGTSDTRLSNVTIELRDSNGNLVATTKTNSQGEYEFTGLQPGTYSVREIQPAGYFHGGEMVGSAGGIIVGADNIGQINLTSGQNGIHYDFCELLPTEIRGKVWADPEGDCVLGLSDVRLSGVTIELLNSNGQVIATTKTNDLGEYSFTNLAPGTYGVREVQPAGYYQGGTMAGSKGGTVSGDSITNIVLASGTQAVNYDFCEELPARLAGKVWADRNGDCVFQVGDIPLSGVKIELLNGTGSVVATTFTDNNGNYSFENLRSGSYSVRETQPAGYYDSGEMVGSAGGVIAANDLIGQINLKSGTNAVNYDFCEEIPAGIRGRVHGDPEGDCIIGPNDVLLAGVKIELLDGNGNVVATTFTNAQGEYAFENLKPGAYSVRETQPAGYFQGAAKPGSTGGNVQGPDLIFGVNLGSGEVSIENNFCELLPASLSGYVWAERDGDCEFDPGEIALNGVSIQLLDEFGSVLQTTLTNNQGFYRFVGLQPGKLYHVREIQPDSYFDGGTVAGTAGGLVLEANKISQVTLDSGEESFNNNFCETPKSKLSGYVFQDGPTIFVENGQTIDPTTVRDGKRDNGDIPLAGVTLILGDQTGKAVLGEDGKPQITTTNSAGYYEFDCLRAGLYTVRQIQPSDYIDSIDTPGTTSGFAINRNQVIPAFILTEVTVPMNFDFIARINVPVGFESQENNFSEVRITTGRIVPPPPVVNIPPIPQYFFAGIPPIAKEPPPVFIPEYVQKLYIDGTNTRGNTWHLSVIDAGHPRTERPEDAKVAFTSMLNLQTWNNVAMDRTPWQLATRDSKIVGMPVFGNQMGLPVPGDYNGDGISEMGVYIDGEWFIDLNHNNQWDKDDMWAKLGTREDLPVVGDWDGDGKDDIGIYGPAWPRDPEAIQREPGLPITLNPPTGKSKNMPPLPEEATLGERALKRTSTGKLRLDLIDHVFNYGTNGDQPVAGDWTGQGSDSIGIFRDGSWNLDVDGNGKITAADVGFSFGQAGDKAVVGDWNGDGTDEVGVYRNGQFILDTNGNHMIDAADTMVNMPTGVDGLPVAGDWDGDGRDEVGVYENGQDVPTVAK
jgi:serine-aspartate repeat-containing protein C/D/E